ncbi:MAG: hypothetical protein RID09_24880 [Coleofasciculus sp. G1-WW12-02]|uniref:hypothetical protein n=1 Tax=Coleofasciculus sp. G1-WW12-02 TaxID=3068483 RepID=UPI0032F2637F
MTFHHCREFAFSVSTTLINQEGKKIPGRPIAVVSSVPSIAPTWVKPISTTTAAKSYYLPQRFQRLAGRSLTPYPYQLRTIEEQPEDFDGDDIVVHTLAQPTSGHNIDFVQTSTRVRCGKLLAYPKHYLATSIPRAKSKVQDLDLGEEEPIWRGIFPLSRSTKVLCSKEIDVKVDELPAWKPHVVIDSYRLEDDDE